MVILQAITVCPWKALNVYELVRGTGSLQYGAQFGGMLNYISKQGDTPGSLVLKVLTALGHINNSAHYNAIGWKDRKVQILWIYLS